MHTPVQPLLLFDKGACAVAFIRTSFEFIEYHRENAETVNSPTVWFYRIFFKVNEKVIYQPVQLYNCSTVSCRAHVIHFIIYSFYPYFSTLPLLGKTSSREVQNRVFRGITSRPNKNRSRSKKINNRFSAFCLRFLDSLLRIRFQMGKRETTILLLGGPEPTNQNKHTRNWIKVSPRYIPLI